jgi:uncharacterized membrane protein YebE (DUF533 family)
MKLGDIIALAAFGAMAFAGYKLYSEQVKAAKEKRAPRDAMTVLKEAVKWQ